MAELLSIPEFFANKNVLITGGSGFLGKVLIEKLLRSCPDVKNIFLILRSKKRKSVQERVKCITDFALFDVIKATNPESLCKIKAISGDCKELGLGLCPEDRQFLIEEINMVFHVAASVRFTEHLTDAIFSNTRSTREVCQLALEIKNLEVLVHISTTYCNTDRKVIEERLYPPHADWKRMIDMAENTDRQIVDAMTANYIKPLPNTYCFTKSLAEHVVYDMCTGKIPTVIYRPSVVISTNSEPFPGWIDNFNGPTAFLVAVGKGLVRSIYADTSIILDYIPADLTVKGIIMSAWKQAIVLGENRHLEISFYNGSNCGINSITIQDTMDLYIKNAPEIPFDDILWCPVDCTITKCYYYHFIKVMLFQFLPAIIIDGLLMLMNKKPMLFKIQKKIFRAMNQGSFFMNNQWEFVNKRCLNLENNLLPRDVDEFSFKWERFLSSYNHFRLSTIGARKYLLKESDDLTKARKHYHRMRILSIVVKTIFRVFLFWLIWSIFLNKCINAYF